MRLGGLRLPALTHVREHEVVKADRLHVPRRVEDRLVGADEEGALPVGVALLDHDLVGRERARVTSPATDPMMSGEQLVHVTSEPHAGRDENDEVVAHALQVREEVRGQHHAHPMAGHNRHEVLEELASRKRVEAPDRLVKYQQLWLFRDGQRKGELGTLAPGKGAGGSVHGAPVTITSAAASRRNSFGYLPSRRDGAACSSVTVAMTTSYSRCPVNGGMVTGRVMGTVTL